MKYEAWCNRGRHRFISPDPTRAWCGRHGCGQDDEQPKQREPKTPLRHKMYKRKKRTKGRHRKIG